MKHGKHLKQFELRALRPSKDQEFRTSKCQVAETAPKMEDLLERAEEALLPVYFPALLEDGLRQSDIQERVVRVSASCTGRKPELLNRFFDKLYTDDANFTFGERLAEFLIAIEPYLPDLPTPPNAA